MPLKPLAFPLVTKRAVRFIPAEKGMVNLTLPQSTTDVTFSPVEVRNLRDFLTARLRDYRRETTRRH